MKSLSDVLQANRRQYFVGRARELGWVESMLAEPDTTSRVLFYYGPGGIGKSTLVAEIHARLREHNIPAGQIDARDLPVTPQAVRRAVEQGLTGLGGGDQQPVWLLIDNFDHLAALETWFHESLLPHLPANVRTVVAGRQPPDTRWRADPAWNGLLRSIELSPLSADEAYDYLDKRGLGASHKDAVHCFAQGYPLALAMAADACLTNNQFDLQADTLDEFLQALALQFVEEARTPVHATALQAAALTNYLSEPLLAAMLPGENAHQLYNWLAGLSCVNTAGRGLIVHDLIGEIIAADLRRRDPDKAERLIYLGEEYFLTQLNSSTKLAAHEIVEDLTYLARQGELSDQMHRAAREQPLYSDAPEAVEVDLVRDWIERHQGEDQRLIFDTWYRRQPAGLVVFRDRENRMQGFACFLELDAATETAFDPVARAVQAHAADAGLKMDGPVELCRYWMHHDRHMQLSSVMNKALTLLIARAATRSDLQASTIVQVDDEMARNMATLADHDCLDDAAYPVGTDRIIVTLHDWRDELIGNWLVRTNRRVRDMTRAAQDIDTNTLTQEQIRESLKHILRHYQHNDSLKQSPLLKSGLFPNDMTGDERVEHLRRLIQQAAGRLRAVPKTRRYYDILWHTYFHPATSRLNAAGKLNMAPSTYYRHLATAVDLLAGELATLQNKCDFDN
ncbi:MAG: hypothetical protein U5P41_11175 [Gammaproteobacteria bacterium]|nr:hypothetical protein [Gammaproteobacteria bacterium]